MTRTSRPSDRTIAALRDALEDPAVIHRYRSHIRSDTPTERGCWLWTGAISGRGHGRLWLATYTITRPDGTKATRDIGIIAHRYGWALTYGLTSLLHTDQVTHLCDEPLCQRPDHWIAGTNTTNQLDYHRRRGLMGSPLRDQRGPIGRARSLRDALRNGTSLTAAHQAGQPTVDLLQPMLPGITQTTENPDQPDTLPLPRGPRRRQA